MKTSYFVHLAIVSVLFALPDAYGVPVIDVAPMVHDFGEVDVGSSATVEIVIGNVGDSSITINSVSFADGSSGDYSITDGPVFFPVFFSAGGSISVEVTFAPSEANGSAAILRISSSDPDEGLVEVELTGQGAGGQSTPLEQAEAIVDFADAAVANDTLFGEGSGNSAQNRLGALLKMLDRARSLIEDENLGDACEQLHSAYKHTDGQARPGDFVTGPAAADLANAIMELIADLECD